MKRFLIAGLLAFGLMGAVPAMAQVVHERVVVHHVVHHPVHRRVIVHRHVQHHYRQPHRTVVVVHH